MTKFISHRGNLNGAVPALENSPDYIDQAIQRGLEVEVDLRMIDDHFYLGHDYPQYKVDPAWLEERHYHLLLHLKDARSLERIIMDYWHWHYFCHAADRYTFTSRMYIWLHDLSIPPTLNTIVPLISNDLRASYKSRDVHAICSDFVIS